MNDLIIYTNNALAVDFLEQKEIFIEVKWFATPSIEVLQSAKNAIRQGGVLLTDPMQSNQKPASPFSAGSSLARRMQPDSTFICPYLSLLISTVNDMLDFKSAKILDNAINTYKKNIKQRFRQYNDDVNKNFQIQDLELLAFALHAALAPTPGPWHG